MRHAEHGQLYGAVVGTRKPSAHEEGTRSERALPKSAADRDDAAALMRHSVMRDRAADYVNLMATQSWRSPRSTAQSSVRIRCLSWGTTALYEMKDQYRRYCDRENVAHIAIETASRVTIPEASAARSRVPFMSAFDLRAGAEPRTERRTAPTLVRWPSAPAAAPLWLTPRASAVSAAHCCAPDRSCARP